MTIGDENNYYLCYNVIRYRTYNKEGEILNNENEKKIRLKKDLGLIIKTKREQLGDSQRKFAKKIGLSNSNLKYIEDGINAPSPEIYKSIILFLNPDNEILRRMDDLYSKIRKTPPPDICEIVINNPNLYEVLRMVGVNTIISDNKVKKLTEVIFPKIIGE